MINFIKGATIPNAEILEEGYCIDNKLIRAVVNAENILKVINNFLDMYEKKSVFLFLEVPCTEDEEKNLNGGETLEKLHYNVYYLDGIPSAMAKDLLELFSEILINDGLVSFGFGTKDGVEIGKYKYNEMELYSSNNPVVQYVDIFEKESINENVNLISPWELINENNPGTCRAYSDKENRDISEIIKILTNTLGLYLAECREE